MIQPLIQMTGTVFILACGALILYLLGGAVVSLLVGDLSDSNRKLILLFTLLCVGWLWFIQRGGR